MQYLNSCCILYSDKAIVQPVKQKLMKQIFQLISIAAVAAAMLLCSSCSKLDDDADQTEIPFMVLSSDGSDIIFEKKYAYTETLHGDFTCINASTNMKQAGSYVSLRIITNNLSEADCMSKVNVQEFSFCKPLSSSSYDYTNQYTGKMYLLKYDNSSKMMRIRLENVECTLSGVKYTFHGDFECEITPSPLNA